LLFVDQINARYDRKEAEKAEAQRAEQIRLLEEAERQARELSAYLKAEKQRAEEARKAAEKAARIEANKTHVEDLQQLLEAKLELARATQAKAKREKDSYKQIQLEERAVRLYVQANNIEAKIKKLSNMVCSKLKRESVRSLLEFPKP
jgi:hypothetical protein